MRAESEHHDAIKGPVPPRQFTGTRSSALLYRVINRAVRPVRLWWQRQAIIATLEGLGGLGDAVAIGGPLVIGKPQLTVFGDDVSTNGLVTIGEGALTIGSHVHMGQGVRIITDNHNFETPTTLPYDSQRNAGPVEIGDCVWIGDSVSIMPGVTIGEGAVVAGGSVVTADVAPLAVVGGAPARLIRQRDAATYQRLREAEQYLNWPRTTDMVLRARVRVGRRPHR